MSVQIVIDENDTIDVIVGVSQVSIEIIANIKREGDTILVGWFARGTPIRRTIGSSEH